MNFSEIAQNRQSCRSYDPTKDVEEEKLDELAAEFDCIVTRRGAGLMQGLVFNRPVGEIIGKALEKGLILINAGTDIIRFVPPLVISKENVDEMVSILKECLQ